LVLSAFKALCDKLSERARGKSANSESTAPVKPRPEKSKPTTLPRASQSRPNQWLVHAAVTKSVDDQPDREE